MGYHTDFTGSFQLDKQLKAEHLAYLKAFSETRRVKRLVDKLKNKPDPFRKAVGLPLGNEGAFFIGITSNHKQDDHDSSILDYNQPPNGQPGRAAASCQ